MLARVAWVGVSVALSLAAACGPASPERTGDAGPIVGSCSCSVSNNGEKRELSCGTDACIAGEKYECVGPVAEVRPLGNCVVTEPLDGGVTDAGQTTKADGGQMMQPDSGSLVDGWKRVPLSTQVNLYAVTGEYQVDARVYVVGENGVCFESSNVGFKRCQFPGTTATLTAVGAGIDERVLVGGENGTLFKRSGLTTTQLQWSEINTGVTGRIGGLVHLATYGFAFGEAGFARVFSPSSMPSFLAPLTGAPAMSNFLAASGVNAQPVSHVWAVGTGGLIAHIDTGNASKVLDIENSNTTVQLNAVLALHDKPTEVVAAGNGGLILSRSANGVWTQQQTPVQNDLFGLVEAPTALYAVGAEGAILARGPDGVWKERPRPVKTTLRAGYARTSTTNITLYLVGDKGVFLTK